MRSKKSLAASTYTSLSDLLLFRFSWQLDVSLSRYRRCSTTVTKGLACPKARPVRKWCHTLYYISTIGELPVILYLGRIQNGDFRDS
jgi:hypothetical protein